MNLWAIFSHMQALKLSCDKKTPPSLTQQNHSKIEIRDPPPLPVNLQTVMKYAKIPLNVKMASILCKEPCISTYG
jgi:hypothetical protein